MQTQNGIAQRHDKRPLAGETLAAQNGVAEPLLDPLAGVVEVRPEFLETKFLDQILLVAGAQQPHQLRVRVEMILDGGLVAARYEQDLFDGVGDQFLRHVLHDGLARHRQHLLGLALSGGQQARAEAGRWHDGAVDHSSNIQRPPARPMW